MKPPPAISKLFAALRAARERLRWWHLPVWCSKWLLRALVLAYFLAGISLLLLRYVAAPEIAARQDEIRQALSDRLGLPVSIAQLDARWTGLRPVLTLVDLRIADRQGREALHLPRVNAEVAWSSLWRRRLEFAALSIHGADLTIRREEDGRIFIAGLPLKSDTQDDGSFSEFLLSQHLIRIDDARLVWSDRQRRAPDLMLDKVALRIESEDNTHRVALRASPDQTLGGAIDLRADLTGDSLQNLDAWRGQLYLDLPRTNLAAWQRWVNYPIELPAGYGALRAWVTLDGPRVASLVTDLALANVRVRLAPELPMLVLSSLQGRVRASHSEHAYSLGGERLSLQTSDGTHVASTHFRFDNRAASHPLGAGGEFSTGTVDLQVLQQLTAYLPLPAQWQTRIAEFAPRGQIERLSSGWRGTWPQLDGMQIATAFKGLAMLATEHRPGFEGLSGDIHGDERRGEYRLSFAQGALELPGIMHEAHLPLEHAQLRGGWTRDGERWRVELTQGELNGADIDLKLQGHWQGLAGESGTIDLEARGSRGDPRAVWRYIPASVSAGVPVWLRHGLTGGIAEDITLNLKGDLSHFPWRTGGGTFRVAGRMRECSLDHTEGWPALQSVEGTFLFEGGRMLIEANSAQYRGVTLSGIRAEIPDLTQEGQQQLRVTGSGSGPTQDFLQFISESPLREPIGNFTHSISARGQGHLALQLDIPLHDSHATRVSGSFRLDDNALQLSATLPALEQVNGSVQFTERSMSLSNTTASFAGARLQASGGSDDSGLLRIVARGRMNAGSLPQIIALPLWRGLSGDTPISAEVLARAHDVEVRVASNLAGLAIQLPAPFSKAAGEPLPLQFSWRSGSTQQQWALQLGSWVDAQWRDECTTQGCQPSSGRIGINTRAPISGRGLQIAGRFNSLDLDAWQPYLTGSGPASGTLPLAVFAELQTERLIAGKHLFRQLSARISQPGEEWQARVESTDLAGELRWSAKDDGNLHARLRHLTLNRAAPLGAGTSPAKAHERLPRIDLISEQFTLHEHPLGRLELRAANNADVWELEQVNIRSEDGELNGQGLYRVREGQPESRLRFKLASTNVGGLLKRFGHADAVARGTADLSGELQWQGAPTDLDYPSLSGQLNLAARDGQFLKLEPGAGRLLGVLSLQAIPRRLTLDFRDIFSEGFAFDSINGALRIESGVLRSDDINIIGPAARVKLAGSTDLSRETHDLQINVQPTLSESVSVGAVALAAVNPAVGVATLLAQKILRDPFEKLFAYQYSVTGPWAEPKVLRLGAPNTANAAQPAAPERTP